MIDHPFLMPHRQGAEFWDESLSTDVDVLSLPAIQELTLVRIHGPFGVLIVRIYTDGIDIGGKSKKVGSKVWCFYWSPVDKGKQTSARRVLRVAISLKYRRVAAFGLLSQGCCFAKKVYSTDSR